MNFKKRVNGSWADTPHYIHNTSTDTITTLPADIYANDDNATVGLVGNMVQNGSPSPSSIIIPSECGERTGNLCNPTPYKTGYAINTFGVEISNSEFNIYSAKVSANSQYCFSLTYLDSDKFRRVRIHEYSAGVWQSQLYEGNCNEFPQNFTTSADIDEVRISIINTTSNLMLNSGSTALPYEPYGIKIPILSANITTPVYLGEVQSERKIAKHEFTGNEDWRLTSAGYFYVSQVPNNYNNSPTLYRKITSVFSHYVAQGNDTNGQSLSDKSACLYCPNNNPNNIYETYIKDSSFSTANELKTYLQQQYANGTPVTVWYVLATETTGIVNEPLRKIGDYADTVSGISIPTTAGANTIDVDTTLQPSEVTVDYKGWHPVQSVHERENGAWD